MHPVTMVLAAAHLRQLRDEAAAWRLAAHGAHRPPALPAWRRSLGAGVNNLSRRLAGLATRLDPPRRRSGHAVGRYGAE